MTNAFGSLHFGKCSAPMRIYPSGLFTSRVHEKSGRQPAFLCSRDAYFAAGVAAGDAAVSALAAFFDFLAFLVFFTFFSTTGVSVEGAGAWAAALKVTAANIAATRADRIFFIIFSF